MKALFPIVCLRQPFRNLSINQNQCFACDIFHLDVFIEKEWEWGQKLTVQSREKLLSFIIRDLPSIPFLFDLKENKFESKFLLSFYDS